MKSALESSSVKLPKVLARIEVLLIFLLFFAVAGSAAPDVNEAHYLAKARQYWDPSWCPDDFFLNSADAHTVFYWTIGWLTQFLSLTAVAWVGRVVTWLLLAWSWRRLSVAVVPGPLVSLLTAGLYAGLLRWGHMAGEWIIGGVEAKSFSYVLVFLGLEAIARRRWRAVWPLMGAATSFHVLVGGWSFVAAVIAWFLGKEDRAEWKSLLPWMVGGACLALPGLVPALTLTWGTDPSIVREANQIYVFERLTHHLVFHRLPVAYIVRFFVLLGCWLGLLWCARVQGASRRLNAFVMGSVFIGAMGVLIDQAAVGLAVVGSWFDVYDLYPRPLVAALLKYYWFRLSDVMVPLGMTFVAVDVLRKIARSRPVTAEYLLAGTTVLVVLHVGEVVYSHRQDPRPPAVIQSMTKEGSTDQERSQAYLGWRATCAWIANNTPTDSLFLTPRNQQTFKWDAQRAEVVARKDIPQDARGIVEWRRRNRELYPGQVEHFGLVTHGEANLIRFSQQYGFDYVVIDRNFSGRRLNLRRVFPLVGDSENPFEVYRMPSRDGVEEWGRTARQAIIAGKRTTMPPHNSLPTWLSGRLGRRLPGPSAQAQFAPELNYGRHQILPFPDTRQAAVLILLFPRQGQWILPLTVRPETMSTHAGQVSFPGGEIEPAETVERAALREYEEELGPHPAEMVMLGRMTPIFVYASNYLVTPCIASCAEPPRFRPNPHEVAHVLETPMVELSDPANYGTHWIRRAGVQFQTPNIRHQDHLIWGATRMMLAELLTLWREFESV